VDGEVVCGAGDGHPRGVFDGVVMAAQKVEIVEHRQWVQAIVIATHSSSLGFTERKPRHRTPHARH
jgi:hypothetical protein